MQNKHAIVQVERGNVEEQECYPLPLEFGLLGCFVAVVFAGCFFIPVKIGGIPPQHATTCRTMPPEWQMHLQSRLRIILRA